MSKLIRSLSSFVNRANKVHVSLFSVFIFLAGCAEHNQHSTESESSKVVAQVAAPIQLKVGEGFVNPLGYYEQRPRFSWKIPQYGKAQFQSAYQIQVATSAKFLDTQVIWDSEKVVSDNSAWISYQGKKLLSRQKVYWRVKMWDENDQASKWSEVNHLEIGLLNNDDWQAKWIGHPDANEFDEDSVFNRTVKGGRFPAPNNKYYRPHYLRKGFSLDKDIYQARLYITSKGVFKPFINGKAISNDVMTPGWTPYHKRIETLTYDVTSHLKIGENTLAAIVAEGWHSGRIFHPTEQQYMLPMRLLAQLEVTFTDGTQQIVASNKDWQSTDQGPIREASNYDGEIYDANFELTNWHSADFDKNQDADKWQKVITEPLEQHVLLKPKRHSTVRETLTIPAVKIVSQKNGITIFDMGQNMVGVPEINIPVIKNQQVKLRFAEAIDKGEFAVTNLRSAKATDLYTPNKTGVVRYQPTFTFHGYQFVELSGYDQASTPTLDWVKGKVLHSDFEVYDNFTSTNADLNQLSDNVSWGLRGNFLDIPTDCPQRDERLGWTGDAQVFAQTSMYKADVYGFWAAWLESVREEQSIDGMVPNFVPFRNFLTSLTGSAWGDAATIVPWELYQFTGDKTILAENYIMMKRWLGYHTFNSYQHISTMSSHGDWLQPFTSDGNNGGDTHRDLIATAYYAYSADIVAKTARILGYHTDADQYEVLFNNIKRKFRDYFFDENLLLRTNIIKPPIYNNGSERQGPTKKISPKTTQTSYLLPLAFDLFAVEEQNQAVEQLVTLIEKSDRHLRTGFLGTPLLAPVLQKFGHSDLMYEILFKESYPSWFYSIKNGATTTWERWDSYSLEIGFNGEKMNSLNHYAYGAIASWFYRGMLGIEQTQPGFKHFKVEPQFTDKLSTVNGSHPTPYGDIAVSWAITDGQLIMSLTVPKNTEARLVLPKIEDIAVIRNRSIAVSESEVLLPGEYEIRGTVAF
ncbi:rhamnosidase [Pseudoalteromonas sp. S1727]|uniref:family 78 glycoside hydrolase catalytic domain n=1 Tax=Pseudoalteromonas sp. S1727 TaxID=2066514 RepID=UPI001108D192|nr:family 78 glycoside hydrolase catalytic domain [Pseudoalteromonas sp. S1727]TMN74150.1 rhamnosidase [Pseudoalteromonas sp. S1727]